MAYDFVGDIHACADELDELLELLGYTEEGHPDGRTLVPVGDFNDRGPHNNRVFKRVMPMFASGAAVGVIGNHCYKLRRWMNGVEVRVGPDLQLTIDEITSEGEEFTAQVREFLDGLPFTLVLNDDILVVHGGYRDGLTEKKARDLAVYGEVGGTTEDGFPVRLDDWAHEYDGPYKLIVRGASSRARSEDDHVGFRCPGLQPRHRLCLRRQAHGA